ncbi:MAG: hypothetical protein QMD03_09545, partial [Syntrophales bacterium]|nr:hypothetical protein [Syntrophales bacterium]
WNCFRFSKKPHPVGGEIHFSISLKDSFLYNEFGILPTGEVWSGTQIVVQEPLEIEAYQKGDDKAHIGTLVEQVSPDKNVNCRCTTAAFTLSPESGASLCCANSPGDRALYAVSVRRLIALHSGFLRTVPRGSALAFG